MGRSAPKIVIVTAEIASMAIAVIPHVQIIATHVMSAIKPGPVLRSAMELKMDHAKIPSNANPAHVYLNRDKNVQKIVIVTAGIALTAIVVIPPVTPVVMPVMSAARKDHARLLPMANRIPALLEESVHLEVAS